jgi:uncharacterized protein with HEPN domain
MSKRVAELFLFDIYVAILKIEKVAEKFNNPESLLHDFVHWDSIIREFEIIGEASKHLINGGLLDKNYRVVVDFRNLLIHNYFGIDPEAVWNVIKEDLPKFKDAIANSINCIDNALKKQLIDSYIEANKHLNFVVTELEKFKKP